MTDMINSNERLSIAPSEVVQVRNLNFFYGSQQALFDISVPINKYKVTALIGPSGCGKSTFLRMLNRMNDLIEVSRFSGQVIVSGEDIYADGVDVVALRKKVGMVFQKSNPFPKSIFDNVAYGPKIHQICKKNELADYVERALQQANLWDEVKDRLHKNALFLSGGQQQRLCIARALAVQPEILLMDEPASALDPRSTTRVEELIKELSDKVTIIIVTHNLQQAARVSEQTIFFYEGRLIEEGPTSTIFNSPKEKHTQNYVFGHFG